MVYPESLANVVKFVSPSRSNAVALLSPIHGGQPPPASFTALPPSNPHHLPLRSHHHRQCRKGPL